MAILFACPGKTANVFVHPETEVATW